jgi:hypothetical protein
MNKSPKITDKLVRKPRRRKVSRLSKGSVQPDYVISGDDEHAIKVDMRLCMESYPCCHTVEQYGTLRNMGAEEIVNEFQRTGKPVPEHFRYILTDDFSRDFFADCDEKQSGRY